jgi:acetolactate synthase-1/2/3 large subunit
LLVLGSRLGEFTSFGYSLPAEGTRWAQVDVEPTAVGPGGRRPNLAVASDVGAFLRVAQHVVAGGVLEMAGLERRRAQNAADREAYETAAVVGTEPWAGPGVHPGRVVASLLATLPPDAILTTDAGDFAGWAARGYRFHKPGTFLGPTSGAMGYGLPAAIAASLARPGRLAVALAGDGGFAMSMAELETAVRERAHVVVLVFDNGRFGTVWRHQVTRGAAPGLATDLGSIDFAAVARACGAFGATVSSDAEFEPALREALEAGKPALLHLIVDRRWTTPDAIPSFEEVTPDEAPAPEIGTVEAAPVDAPAVDAPAAPGGLWDAEPVPAPEAPTEEATE